MSSCNQKVHHSTDKCKLPRTRPCNLCKNITSVFICTTLRPRLVNRRPWGIQFMSIDNLNSWLAIVIAGIQISAIIYGGFKLFNKITVRLDKLEEQYKPNGGSSMRDAINRIENKLSKLEGKFEQHVDES